ncbi:hypothetical protein TIFTF001_035351 [Ficus carica]|uniref:F-box associated beta-propeller type 1 domain-containing protein n=1 Tax=Ficus carica TaxID=3494 RepID=A0AA88E1D7_FICCA|nr:hypothetical protein TIFTF001_035310 [Ficus carica]GMN66260.1 hypothetical protein TIFTF001_035327 [Ficus carica]GMN66267.1 hypothetical protein TIFTF001_035334 [Ficus carica]GMN66284.1 hypothetical protein TIFTF001_035351 [Ficus carica]
MNLCIFGLVSEWWNVNINQEYECSRVHGDVCHAYANVSSDGSRVDFGAIIRNEYFANEQSKTFEGTNRSCVKARISSCPWTPNAYGVPTLSLDYLSLEVIDIMDSSDGLICCQEKTGLAREFFVCNPVITRHLNYKFKPYPGVVIIMEPNQSPDDISPLQYTVICVYITNFDTGTIRFDKYHSVEECWKVCSLPSANLDNILEHYYGVHVKGTVYWHTQHHDKILAFDVAAERAKMVCANLGENYPGILRVKDEKLILTRVGIQSDIIVEVLSNEKSEIWEEKYRINLSSQHSLYLFTCENYSVLITTEQHICSYNLTTTGVSCLGNVQDYHPYLCRERTCVYVNNLVAVA